LSELDVVLHRGALVGELLQALVAQRLDVAHRGVGGEQELVVFLLLPGELVATLELGELLGRLLRLEAADFDGLVVEDRALALGVFGRDRSP
jgi:hypothetical protein